MGRPAEVAPVIDRLAMMPCRRKAHAERLSRGKCEHWPVSSHVRFGAVGSLENHADESEVHTHALLPSWSAMTVYDGA